MPVATSNLPEKDNDRRQPNSTKGTMKSVSNQSGLPARWPCKAMIASTETMPFHDDAERQGAEQRPAGRGGHRQAELQPRAGAVGHVGALRERTGRRRWPLPAPKKISLLDALGQRRAALGRLAPVQQRVDQTAGADDHKGNRHGEHQPDQQAIAAHQHGHVGIGRIVPARIAIARDRRRTDRSGRGRPGRFRVRWNKSAGMS